VNTTFGRLRQAVPMVLALVVLRPPTLLPQTQPSLADLEKRVSELENRLIKGPGTATRIRAPFEVVDAAGNVILQVTQGEPKGASVAIWTRGSGKGAALTFEKNGQEIAGLGVGDKGDGELTISDAAGTIRADILGSGFLSIRDKSGSPVAGILETEKGYGRFVVGHGQATLATLEEDENGGSLLIHDASGDVVAEVGVDDDGAGGVSILDKDTELAALRPSSDGDGGEVIVANGEGKHLVTLGPSKSGAGVVSVSSAEGTPMANLTGGLNGAGALLVGNSQGKVVAQMSSGAGGMGLVQISRPGGGAQAVLGADASGGLMQVSNAAGTPVGSFMAASDGAGFWQLTNSGGNTIVEAGLNGSVGVVKAGPRYICENSGMTMPTVHLVALPDCIKGKYK
jgi:hypothetical protein